MTGRKGVPADLKRSNFDPFNAVLKEGEIYGKGAAGKFKKNGFTRLGFFLLAPAFLRGSAYFFPICGCFFSRARQSSGSWLYCRARNG